MRKVLSIAGSDCSGGAGIQADLKTIMAHKLYGMSVITALTAQNTMGVSGVLEATPEFVEMQIDAIFTDIVPDAVKIGMVSNAEIIKTIAERLVYYNVKNIVLDPVMVSTSGSKLLNDDAIEMLKLKLFPIADIITPNIPEAESLCGFSIKTIEDMEKAAKQISTEIKGAVLIKGGHFEDNSNDLLLYNGNINLFYSPKIANSNTHGTGCTLSSAIACNLAEGYDMKTSIQNAKNYITGALNDNLNLGKGNGPLNHSYNLDVIK
nr:bifunctional hydroxymethylpyrimidine kinase/phosphomethylpyrimidine kinase [Sedimentibacter sp.]